MEQETGDVVSNSVVVPGPGPALLKIERKSRYGSVPGLDDDELADPDELERQVMQEEWGLVLALPVRGTPGKQHGFRPDIDEDGLVVGAFATVDFDRTMPAFDKMRYKVDRLREELRDVLIMLAIVKERLPRCQHQVFKYLKLGIIEVEHIIDEDMHAAARLYLRARRTQQEIARLQEVSEARQQRALAAWLRQ